MQDDHGSQARNCERVPSTGYKISEIFGCNTFSDRVMAERLPAKTYRRLKETIQNGVPLDEDVANVVAHAMKEWAIANGATHYCHWFQPMTGLTAEKHDSFLDLDENGRAMERFAGRNLIQGEPDASSFPSGGLRTTFEARGYTGWDPSSPAFLMPGPRAATLCIPTVFTTYHGEAMDKKTPLLRSLRNLQTSALQLLALFDERNPERPRAKRVTATVGSEQEYFLIDAEDWFSRPDLVQAGRTLVGAPPAKGQQLEDHYFGSIRERVQAYMQDVEIELYKLGVPAKTRHNEVAPSQFEIAPIFEEANRAADHNFLTMEVMRRTAIRHGLAVLLHEKPFAGINGSGKHCNWSLSDDLGNNLLDPGDSPQENLQFLSVLCAVLEGVFKHSELLRAGIANSGNDHRLGANEAPPAILSVFLGQSLSGVLNSIAERSDIGSSPQKILEMGLSQLPGIVADNTDRNRTSPFAFTGNKFEFRAVGASSPISTPVAYLTAAVAESLRVMSERIARARSSTESFEAAVMQALRESIEISKPVRFEGNNYAEEWVAEASDRGLANLRDTPAALAVLNKKEVIEFMDREGILTPLELQARYHAQLHRFINDVEIEVDVSLDLARTFVLPASMSYQRDVASSIDACQGLVGDEALSHQSVLLASLAHTIGELLQAMTRLEAEWCSAKGCSGPQEEADAYGSKVRLAMNQLRAVCDQLERMVPDSLWPMPKYREILFQAD